MAALLSQYKFIGLCIGNPSLAMKIFSHKSSQTPCAMDQNSASVLDFATLGFLFLHFTRLPPTNIQ